MWNDSYEHLGKHLLHNNTIAYILYSNIEYYIIDVYVNIMPPPPYVISFI